jgi:hypothetical protein
MTKRLATILLVTIFLIVVSSPSIRAQDSNPHTVSLKGINAVSVLVEPPDDGAKTLGLTREAIQTDVELKLRLAGIRVVPKEEGIKLLGDPCLYVQVTVTNAARAANIEVELKQNALLQRNGDLVFGVATWDTGQVDQNATAQNIRDAIKDDIDEFLNAWLSVNPKK